KRQELAGQYHLVRIGKSQADGYRAGSDVGFARSVVDLASMGIVAAVRQAKGQSQTFRLETPPLVSCLLAQGDKDVFRQRKGDPDAPASLYQDQPGCRG